MVLLRHTASPVPWRAMMQLIADAALQRRAERLRLRSITSVAAGLRIRGEDNEVSWLKPGPTDTL
jgi:hypothetical protein